MLFLIHIAKHNSAGGQECLNHKPNDHRILSNMAAQMHKALQILQTPHFLCHESLWGSLYNEGPRTWDTTVDFCLIGNLLDEQDEGYIQKVFKSQNLQLEYDMLDGIYKAHPMEEQSTNKGVLFGRLFLFQESSVGSMMLRKAGMKRAILPEDCENPLLECFPDLLARQPFSMIKYGPHELPGPREGIEIQKYHYPDDWWLQRKFPSCWRYINYIHSVSSQIAPSAKWFVTL